MFSDYLTLLDKHSSLQLDVKETTYSDVNCTTLARSNFPCSLKS